METVSERDTEKIEVRRGNQGQDHITYAYLSTDEILSTPDAQGQAFFFFPSTRKSLRKISKSQEKFEKIEVKWEPGK